jgi:hypothetical protein
MARAKEISKDLNRFLHPQIEAAAVQSVAVV